MLRFGALKAYGSGRNSNGTHLRDVHALIANLIEEYTPESVAVESVFTALNVKTALRLAELRGVILLAAEQAGIPAFSYSPREVKASVAGYGHADKEQVQQMVRALLGMTETPEPADAADALAVALCHVQVSAYQARLMVPASQAGAGSLAIAARTRRRERISRVSSPLP